MALKECGTEAEQEAVEHLRKVRQSHFLKRCRRDSPQFAYLNWVEAVLKYKLRSIAASRCRKMMDEGLRIFIGHRMPDEARAMLADRAKMTKRKWETAPNRTHVLELLDRYAPSLEALPHGEATSQVVAGIREACDRFGWDAHKDLEAAIDRLRESTKSIPCLL